MNHQSKIAIIGAGPAGIACAVQLKRFGIEALLFEKKQIGGLLRNANWVENYLGFESGISGQDLVEKFGKNLEILNIKPVFEEVIKVSYDKCFLLETEKGFYQSEILVIASGTKPKKLDYKNLTYEIVDLDKKSCINKNFAIIGAGDAAFDYALNLVNNYNANEVNILNRSEKVKCIPLLEERALYTGKINHIKNVKANDIEKFIANTDYTLAAIGREPYLDFIDETILSNKQKLEGEKRLYFIGDVVNNFLRQTLIAAGQGMKAAMKIVS